MSRTSRSPGAGTRVAREAEWLLGGIDILAVGSGPTRSAAFAELSAADWDVAYRMLLASAIELTSAVLPSMTDRGWGRLVYITSTGPLRPLPALHLSNVMRGGVHSLARSVAAEVAASGVTANVVAPAWIDTPRTPAPGSTARLRPCARRPRPTCPAGRLGSVHEVGSVVAWLCEDDSAFVTGTTVPVDGGYLLT